MSHSRSSGVERAETSTLRSFVDRNRLFVYFIIGDILLAGLGYGLDAWYQSKPDAEIMLIVAGLIGTFALILGVIGVCLFIASFFLMS